MTVETQIRVLTRRLDSTIRKEILMPDTALRATEAARRLQIPAKELLRLLHTKQIRYIMIDGIAHVPEDAVEEYRSRIKS